MQTLHGLTLVSNDRNAPLCPQRRQKVLSTLVDYRQTARTDPGQQRQECPAMPPEKTEGPLYSGGLQTDCTD
ncbi:hypothetical protein ACOMHN_023979 [Nucella lapillus]